jgi:hypothetical protein
VPSTASQRQAVTLSLAQDLHGHSAKQTRGRMVKIHRILPTDMMIHPSAASSTNLEIEVFRIMHHPVHFNLSVWLITHRIVFFSHNKTAPTGLLTAEIIQRTGHVNHSPIVSAGCRLPR